MPGPSDHEALRRERARLQDALASLGSLRQRPPRNADAEAAFDDFDWGDNDEPAAAPPVNRVFAPPAAPAPPAPPSVPFVRPMTLADVDWDAADAASAPPPTTPASPLTDAFDWHDPDDPPARDSQPPAAPTPLPDTTHDVFDRFHWE